MRRDQEHASRPGYRGTVSNCPDILGVEKESPSDGDEANAEHVGFAARLGFALLRQVETAWLAGLPRNSPTRSVIVATPVQEAPGDPFTLEPGLDERRLAVG